MEKLTLKRRKFHPPFEDNNTTKISQNSPDVTSSQVEVRKKRIFQRAISSAKKHGINVIPGRENGGHGNCSYEATIFNLNDRNCFGEKFPMSPSFYRRIWNTDMMNKLIDKISMEPRIDTSWDERWVHRVDGIWSVREAFF